MAQRKKKQKETKRAAANVKSAVGTSWWDNLSDPVQHGICLAFLLIVAFVFYAPALFSGKSLVGGDTVSWRAAAESMLTYRETTGEEPLWATNVFGGMPGYVISFPKKIPQLDLIPDGLRSFAWPVSHFIFLLLGTYLLVFLLTRDKLSSVLTACAYGLTTYLPILLVSGHNTKFIALCYVPWVVLAFVYVLRKPGLMAGLLFAAALGLNLRANHVQITYYLAFLLGIWWIVAGIGAIRRGEGKAFAATTGWLVLGTVLAVFMVAQPYLSNYEYNRYSIRGASSGGGVGGLDWDYAMAWSQGIGEMVTLLIADAYGGSKLYWGAKIFTGGPHYAGGIVLLLAALALWRYRRRAVGALGIGALLMTLFALGENFEILNRLMFNYFPLFKIFRVPETWLIMVVFALAILAGMGLFYVVRREPSSEAEQEKTKAVYITAGIALGLVAVLFIGKHAFFDFEREGEFAQAQQVVASRMQRPVNDPQVISTTEQLLQEQIITPRIDAFNGDALRTLLFLLLAAGMLIAYRKHKVQGWVLQATLVLLVAIDLGGVGRRYFNEDLMVSQSNAEARIPTYDFDRYILQQQDEAGGSGHFRVLSLEQVDQTKNARPSYHYESLGGYSAAKLRLYQDYLEHLLFDPQTGMPNPNALDLLNTRYVVARSPLPGLQAVYRGEQTQMVVLENDDALPRAFFAGQVEVLASPEETWERLRDPALDLHRTAILPEGADVVTTPIDSSSTASVSLQRYGPREIAWEVATDAPRLLVVSEIYYPAGWKAYVDGTPAPIRRADYLLRAVSVPAGAREVVMRFEPASYTTSLWLAGGATLLVYGGILAMLGMAWYRRRSASADVPASANTQET